MNEDIIADMGKYVISTKPDVLSCLALGSCVGVALWDSQLCIGGLAHVMLPSSKLLGVKEGQNVNKFADYAVPNMVKDLQAKGVEISRIKAKLVGGAHMFRGIATSVDDIGKRNSESVKEELKKLNIQVIAEILGGSVGRTTRLILETGVYTIRSKEGTKEI
jgi:chemotaxis protein CheD